jgi:hypothetical protein
MRVVILSTSRDMVGDLVTVRAEIQEQATGYWRVKDTIEVDVEGGARMEDEELADKVMEIYNA